MDRKVKIIFAVAVGVTIMIAVGVIGWNFQKNSDAENNFTKDSSGTSIPVSPKFACTREAKQCPDGTYVGRTGPNCEFEKCPGEKDDNIAGWQTYRNEKYGFELNYPNKYDLIMDETGWSNSIFLLWDKCHCTQTYGVVAEMWKNEGDFKKEHLVVSDSEYVIKKIGNNWLTLWNLGDYEDLEKILSTFKFTK